MKARTKQLALRVMNLVDALPQTDKAGILGRQLLRCATSVGANYRAACRARSTAEFIAKLGVVLEEADEAGFWIELIVEGGILPEERCVDLRKEADEICAVLFSAQRSARAVDQ